MVMIQCSEPSYLKSNENVKNKLYFVWIIYRTLPAVVTIPSTELLDTLRGAAVHRQHLHDQLPEEVEEGLLDALYSHAEPPCVDS